MRVVECVGLQAERGLPLATQLYTFVEAQRVHRPRRAVGATSLEQPPAAASAAREQLDAHVRDIVGWHFDPATGCPFWLDWAEKAGWDPRAEVNGFEDLKKFGFFDDEWMRGGPVERCWATASG